jgi:hypothetical protein
MLIRRRRLEIRLPLFAVAAATDLDSGGGGTPPVPLC